MLLPRGSLLAPSGGSGQQQQKQLSLAARNAEALFEAKNVAEIRQIEARTRQDIEEKNLQLRQLVGDSYRDLIDGTDQIIDISTKCHSILGSVLGIQEAFASLAVSVSATPGGQEGKESVRKHRELHAVGGRVKYVMDTPEVIWGCLDAAQHLEAARRLLRVHAVHDHLQASFGALAAAKFPVLAHQWQTVVKFRQAILDSAGALLSTQPGLSTGGAADALAAVALLEGRDSAAGLQGFLAARTAWVQQQLEAAAASALEAGSEGRAPGAVLAQLAQSVQCCVAQVGELFTAPQQHQEQLDASQASSRLQAVVQEEEADASELFFGSADGSAEGSVSPEAVQWRERAAAFTEQLAPLQRQQVQDATTAWLADIAQLCSRHGLQLLQHCQDADSLLEAQLAVHEAVASWSVSATRGSDEEAGSEQEPAAAADQKEQPLAAGMSRLSRVSAAGGPSPSGSPTVRGGHQAASSRAAPSDWERTTEALLGRRLDLWQALFHAPFLERCKQLIAAALSEACSSIEEPLAAALQQAACHSPPEAAGQLQPGAWPSLPSSTGAPAAGGDEAASAGGLEHSAFSVRRALSLHAPGALAAAGGDDASAADFRSDVQTLLTVFDQQLHAALQAVLLLTATPTAAGQQQQRGLGAPPSRSGSLQPTSSTTSALLRASSMQPGSPAAAAAAAGGTSAGAAAAAAAGKQRAADLEVFAQQQCLQLTQQLAGRLQQQLASLPAPPAGVRGANDVEQVLLLARLCTALAAHSCVLPAFLGPPDGWPAAVRAGPHVATASGGAGAGGGRSGGLPASLAQGVGALGPAAAALLRMHHPGLDSKDPGQAGAATQLAALQRQLHDVACSGYASWAAWVGASLALDLAAAVTGDELLHSDSTPLSWTEVRLAAAAGDAATAAGAGGAAAEGLLDILDDAAAAGDMSFALPACPSAAVMQLLSCACWEVRRAGEHLITADALQLLLWEVHGAALGALQQELQQQQQGSGGRTTPPVAAADGGAPASNGNAGRARLSEKGVLQLLFDQRLLRDVLGGGLPPAAVVAAAPAAAGTPSTPELLAGRRQLAARVEQQLQDLMDPIDWATYEPHLWGHVQRYYSRTSVLLGSLAQMSRPYGDASAALGAGGGGAGAADINALNVLPVVPRFHYLPISTPSAASLPRQRSALVALSASAAAAAALAGGAGGGAGGLQPPHQQQQHQQAPRASVDTAQAASDLAAQYLIADISGGAGRDAAGGGGAASYGQQLGLGAQQQQQQQGAGAASYYDAAGGGSALSALQAKLQAATGAGSSFTAFGSMLGDRAAEVTAMAQNFGDLLPSAGGLGGLSQSAVGGLLSSFARRDGGGAAGGSGG